MFLKSTSSKTCPLRLYAIPAALALPQGLYALMGHHLKPGTAPMPPIILPLPSQPKDISVRGTPHVGHFSTAGADVGAGDAPEPLVLACMAK